MAAITVEQRIVSQFSSSVSDLLQSFADEGLTSKQVAEKLQCGVSNVRRIARKYNVRFNQPAPQPKFTHSSEFLDKAINAKNFLSRVWRKEQSSFMDANFVTE
jgi:primosomal protein N''